MLRAHSGLAHHPHIEPDENTHYVVGIDIETGRTIGAVSLKRFTDLMLEAHIYVLPEYWGSGASSAFAQKVYLEIFVPSEYNKLMTYTPSSCTQVINFLESFQFKKVGEITDGLTYMNEIVDLYIYVNSKLQRGS